MKKLSLFILCCFMPTIANASNSNQQTNTDVGEQFQNENARKTEVQPVLNSEVNPELPNTDEKTAFVPNIKSRDKEGWGEKQHQTFTAKKFTLFKENNPKRPGGYGEFYNCPISADKKYCQPVKGQLNTDVGVILRQSKPTLDSDGFITDLQPPVLYDQGSKNGFEKYFYRFWTNKEAECKDMKQSSCWSPSYPLICNANFNNTDFLKFKSEKTGEEKARHYFGWKDDLTKTINNAYTTENDYKVHVYMAPFKKNNFGRLVEDHNKGIFTALSPTGWVKKGNCLDPEFDYDLEQNDSNGNTTTEVLTLDDTTSSLSEPKSIKIGGQILPCGNFSDNSKYKGKNFKEIATEYCENDYYSIGNDHNNNYDTYKIHMPLSTKFTDANTLTPKKQEIANYYDFNHTKEMRTRICGTCKPVKSKEICEEIVRGVLYEKCSKDSDKFKCDKQQLESVVSRLKFDEPGNFIGMFNGNKIAGYTKQSLKCEICLYRLDAILIGGIDTDGNKYEGLLN